MSEQKLVPKLRFKEFNEDWNKILLNKLLSFKNGLNASKEQYGYGTKFINVSDILDNSYITYENIADSVNITDEEFENYKIEYGDIVFQRSSENREEVGTANVYLGNKPCIYGGFVIRGKKIGDYNPFFLKEVLQTTRVRKEITSWSGGSTRYNIGQEALNKISIIIPSINEQNAIADLIFKLNNKIELLEHKHQHYQEFKKYLMQQIFAQKLRFEEFDDDWKSYKIGDISKTYSGGTPSTSIKKYYEGDIPFIKSGEIGNTFTEQYITEEAIDNSSAKRVNKGDLLLALYGATSGEVAISKIDGAINQAVLKIENNMDNYFQYYYFLNYKDQIIHKYLQGGQGNLSANIIKNLEIKFPKLKEQEKIADFLSNVDRKIETIQTQLSEMTEFKKGLLQQMLI